MWFIQAFQGKLFMFVPSKNVRTRYASYKKIIWFYLVRAEVVLVVVLPLFYFQKLICVMSAFFFLRKFCRIEVR